MDWLYILGSIGSILFGTACVPMAWKTLRKGADIGNPISTIWTFVAATLLFGVYLVGKTGWNIPSAVVLLEFLCWSIAVWYHYFPRFSVEDGSGKIFANAYNVGYCTRDDGHDGPCNGWPRHTCPGFVGFERGRRLP